jgi:4-hydroxy-2-oxoglutarate aldolase
MMLIEGLQLPLTTTFYSDGRLNLPKLEHNVERYCRTPAAGLVVLGDSGEPTLLSDTESRQVLRSAIQAAAPQKVMIAGALRDSVAGTLDLIEAAAALKYDAVLVKCPAILRPGGRGMRKTEVLTYFHTVADRSALPIMLSSDAYGHCEMLPAELVIELASRPQIIGTLDGGLGCEWIEKVRAGTMSIKREVTVTTVFGAVTARMRVEESGSNDGLIAAGTLAGGGAALAVGTAKAGVKMRTKTVGFQVLVGSTFGMLDGLMAGAVGTAPPFAASAPQACYEVLAAWKDGDEGLAREKQERLRDVAVKLEQDLGVAAIKFGCDLNGYFGGQPRLPLLSLTGQERAEVEKLMQGLRN